MAQLDACLTGDQEVVGGTSTESATFFHGDLITKYFLWSFSSVSLIQEGTCQFLVQEGAQYWFTA